MPHRAVPTPLSPLPTSLSELTEAERLLAWSFRHWVAGLAGAAPHVRALVWNELAQRLGSAHGKLALAALAHIVNLLHEHARRRIRVHRPCCPCLGADELGLIALVAACQHASWSLARARAEWWVTDDGVGALIACGAALARALAARGQHLPERARTGAAATLLAEDARPSAH